MKVYLLYKSQGQYSDKLLAIYQTKGQAIKAKFIAQEITKHNTDFYIIERYVINT